MRYFGLDFGEAFEAMGAVWQNQDSMCCPRSAFNTSANGRTTSVWTEDHSGEDLFRLELNERRISFEEGDEQQVVTWLDRAFAPASM